jgi:hypothetical protein
VAIGIGLRQVQDALEMKATMVQREFIELSDELDDLSGQIIEADDEDKGDLREKQKELRVRQGGIAEEINHWRTLSRRVMQQAGADSVRSFLTELLDADDERVQISAKNSLHLLDLPPEERPLMEDEAIEKAQTPAGRLLERARTEYDLRIADSGVRQREAVSFANRSGMAMDDDALEKITAALDDPDPLVREVATLTAIQLLRFRAMRVADLGVAHDAVKKLAKLNSLAAVPVLIEIVENPRTGYIEEDGEPVETDNGRSRLVALLRLVEWHTPEAQTAIRSMKFDQDAHIVKAAERALTLFPEPWTGTLPR